MSLSWIFQVYVIEFWAMVFGIFYDCFKGTVGLFFPGAPKSLKNDIVLVTGAAMGIGKLQALNFAKKGVKMVICWDLNEVENNKTVKEIQALGVKAAGYKINLCDRQAIYDLQKQVQKMVNDSFGPSAYVSILVNNAGVVTGKKFMDSPDHLIDLTMNVNINAHFWTLKSFLPKMIENKKGHVVTIASMAGIGAAPGMVDYNASKFAAVGFSEALKLEMEQNNTGVEVTCICPYLIDTGMFDGAKNKHDFILPILKPDWVAGRIIKAVEYNEFVVMLPKFLFAAAWIKHMLPFKSIIRMNQFIGMNDTMSEFRGRK